MFSQVSVCPSGGSLSGPGQRPPGQRPPWTETPLDRDPLDRDPLDGDCPLTETPWTEVPLWTELPLWTETHPPCTETHLDSDPHTVTCGQYASYWNAFLSWLFLPLAYVVSVKVTFSIMPVCQSACSQGEGPHVTTIHEDWDPPTIWTPRDSLPTTWTQPLHIMASGRLAFD